jgi:hypothetical protein
MREHGRSNFLCYSFRNVTQPTSPRTLFYFGWDFQPRTKITRILDFATFARIIRRGYNQPITPQTLSNQHQILISTGTDEIKFVPYSSSNVEKYNGYFSTCMQNIQAHLSEIIFKEEQIKKNIKLILSISTTISKRSLFDFFFGPGTGEIRQK